MSAKSSKLKTNYRDLSLDVGSIFHLFLSLRLWSVRFNLVGLDQICPVLLCNLVKIYEGKRKNLAIRQDASGGVVVMGKKRRKNNNERQITRHSWLAFQFFNSLA